MLVVADASPLNVLIRTGQVELLQALFARVVIPPAVAQEMMHPNAPQAVRDWIAARPSWLSIQQPVKVDGSLNVDPGEREAISLALELRAELLLVDDLKARVAARRVGISIMGTLGVLELAATRSLTELSVAIGKLKTTDFSIDPRLLEQALARDAERRNG